MFLPTSLVGSYPQPEWLIDRGRLAGRFPPRVRATELWRVAPEFLEQAQADATLLAIRAQEDAGLDIITDGEIRRESYSNRFATALDGVDIDNPGTALDRSGHPNPVPRVVGPIRRRHAVEVEDLTPPDWEPRFVDYLYLSFTNATAFSPTDVMPLVHWAKLTMLVQSGVSLSLGALVIARAVNIL